MTAQEFVDVVSERGDAELDVHVRPQSAILSLNNELIPHFIGLYERLDEDWRALVEYLARATTLQLPANLPRRNWTGTGIKDTTREELSSGDIAKLNRRFAADYANFYSAAARARLPLIRAPGQAGVGASLRRRVWGVLRRALSESAAKIHRRL